MRPRSPALTRRTLLGAALALAPGRAQPRETTTLDCPMEVAGDWRGSLPGDVRAVLGRMREGCLSDVAQRSDRQPRALRVIDKPAGPPHIWLQSAEPGLATIAVNVGPRDWCNLAYQFGHELGHVYANSWRADAVPGGPSQWLEEALVEAFSLRGLARMAAGWRVRPPFPNDGAYADAILEYRDRLLQVDWRRAQDERAPAGLAAWYRTRRGGLGQAGVEDARPAVPACLALFEEDAGTIEDLAALNRWPERARLDMPAYLARWEASCAERATAKRLPGRLRALLL